MTWDAHKGQDMTDKQFFFEEPAKGLEEGTVSGGRELKCRVIVLLTAMAFAVVLAAGAAAAAVESPANDATTTTTTIQQESTAQGGPTTSSEVQPNAGSIGSTAVAWGLNNVGQLGNGRWGGYYSAPVAVHIEGLVITTVAGGTWHSLALKTDGTVLAWGYNVNGQLGNGTTTSPTNTDCPGCIDTPVQVTGLSGVTAIAAGYNHSLAIKKTKKGTVVKAWGDDFYGQLGDGATNTTRSTPVQVKGLRGVTAIAGGYTHSLALKSDGTVRSWGANDSGQLGNGTTTTTGCQCIATPVRVKGLKGVTAIAGGGDDSLAIIKAGSGTFWTWGQLNDSNTPVQVTGLCGATSVAGGGAHGLATFYREGPGGPCPGT